MRRSIAAFGRLLVTLGLLILLFVTYELWGTGIFTARTQTQLKSEFQQKLQAIADNPVVTTPTVKPTNPRRTTTTIDPRLLVAPDEGEALAQILIDKIGVDWTVVEGVHLTDLAKGPGHYPGTPLPGQIGNAAIAGHRTTHGAPFYRVDELTLGDKIVINTLAGTYTYAVTRKPFAVDPTDYGVVANTPGPVLTLTSCEPKYSAAKRIIVRARLVTNQSAKPHKPPTVINGKKVAPPARKALATGLEGQSHSVRPAIAWGLFMTFVGVLWWWAFRRWRHPFTWLGGLVPFLIVLFPFFVYLERALPSGY